MDCLRITLCEANECVSGPKFSSEFRRDFEELLRWRRDVRHFCTDPVEDQLVQELLRRAMMSPSVGYSQPWRWVLVEDLERRRLVAECFERANTAAQATYLDERREQYGRLKLAGLREAPVHLAVFAEEGTTTGSGLGRGTMPETLVWSVVMAIHSFWLAARSEGLGVGWVSILDPDAIGPILDTPPDWRFVAYLCLGWPEEAHEDPLLERSGWESRLQQKDLVLIR